ncbi:MAG: hypothetical protein IJJ38_01500, partial [Lachnospiraceae bacterium]|nr:hypothetical protein [Lachnospiraceae bacterium]
LFFPQATAFVLGKSTTKIIKISNRSDLLGESEATLIFSPGDSFRLGVIESEDKKNLQQVRPVGGI